MVVASLPWVRLSDDLASRRTGCCAELPDVCVRAKQRMHWHAVHMVRSRLLQFLESPSSQKLQMVVVYRMV